MKRLFLLGGYDLEMEEIKKLLDKHGCKYLDKKLNWGAKLSDYEDALSFDGALYGIELTEDIEPPSNYTAIDHHGERFRCAGALEQVADLLGVELDRWQKLVAANDKGYIPAMQRLCATDDEIAAIRQADRKAQGVTDEEEAIAEKEAAGEISQHSGVYVVKTSLEHFSPLVDRLYHAGKSPLIVHNERTLSYYGSNIDRLIEKFHDAVKKQQAYYGGNPKGYFGLTADYFNGHDMEESVQKIIETTTQEQTRIYSYHIFMFPFCLEPESYTYIIDDQVNEALIDAGWKSAPFEIRTPSDYNEFVYFHKYVTDELYQKTSSFDKEKTTHCYKRPEYEESEWTFIIKGEAYSLKNSQVALHLFRTGIGIVSIHLINERYESDDDILRINDFARRVYPPFLGETYPLTKETKNALLPQCVTVSLKNGKDIVENFDYTKLPSIGETPRLAAYMTDILSREFIVNYQVRPVIDDRMYTLCYIAKDGKAADLHHYGYRDDERASDFWYRFIYVDGEEITCFSPEMKKRLIEEATYDRWMDHPWGCSLYGITRYGFMLYSSHGLLHTHLRTIYFKMAILALAQRATILRFSDEITEILSGHSKKIAERSSQLYFDYIYFINRLHFREVTPQEQGIELYDMMMKQMQIEKQLKELDGEIAELHNYVQMENEEKRNSRLEFISKLGAIFLPPSLLAGIYGMNSIEFTKYYPFLSLLTLLIASAVGACFVFECHTKKISLKTIKSLIAIIVFIALLFIPYCFTKENSTPKEKGESCLQKIFKSDVPSNSTPR